MVNYSNAPFFEYFHDKNTPNGTKKHREIPNQKAAKMAKMFFFLFFLLQTG